MKILRCKSCGNEYAEGEDSNYDILQGDYREHEVFKSQIRELIDDLDTGCIANASAEHKRNKHQKRLQHLLDYL